MKYKKKHFLAIYRYLVSYPSGKNAGGVKLTTHFHLMQRLRVCGTIPPLSKYFFMWWGLIKQEMFFTA
jgi:hypothetical protein